MSNLNLVPEPMKCERSAGSLEVPERIAIATEFPLGRWFVRSIEDWLGCEVALAGVGERPWLEVVSDPEIEPEGYALAIGETVQVTASSLGGVRAAWQTLRQLAGPAAFGAVPAARRGGRAILPRVAIRDAPRFAHRGVLLDVARSFVPKDEVLRFIDLIAAHKLNVLHLHLTDDQGWRVEIRAFPRLTEVGCWRRDSVLAYRNHEADPLMVGRPHGGFYTQDDLREIVAFAAECGVTVIPEIDVPGHSQAAIAAYPWLGVDAPDVDVWTMWGVSDCILDPSERALAFYKQVIDEIVDIFPGDVIHLGGDEVPYERWESSPDIVHRATALGFDSVAGLHGWFIGELLAHVEAKGRRAGVWHEAIGPGLPVRAVVNAWWGSGSVIASLRAGHDTVVSRADHAYLDHREADTPEEPSACRPVATLEQVHRFDPAPAEIADTLAHGGVRLLGVQAHLWTEYLDTREIRDYHTYPRLSAFSEVAWCQQLPAHGDFLAKLRDGHLDRLRAAGVAFRPISGPAPWQQRPDLSAYCRLDG